MSPKLELDDVVSGQKFIYNVGMILAKNLEVLIVHFIENANAITQV